jgi:hypothetical protein
MFSRLHDTTTMLTTPINDISECIDTTRNARHIHSHDKNAGLILANDPFGTNSRTHSPVEPTTFHITNFTTLRSDGCRLHMAFKRYPELISREFLLGPLSHFGLSLPQDWPHDTFSVSGPVEWCTDSSGRNL